MNNDQNLQNAFLRIETQESSQFIIIGGGTNVSKREYFAKFLVKVYTPEASITNMV